MPYRNRRKAELYIPVSILARIVLEHLRKDSSTFSPVFALDSRKINSEMKSQRVEER